MRFVILLLLVSSVGMVAAQTPEAITSYIARYKFIAIEEMKTYGIPASITLAQGIHESGCGLSPLAKNSNNHFGIKCHEEWAGEKYHHDDDLPQECFRVYASPEESFRDHSEFLKNRPRYSNLFELEPSDYKGWAKGLKAAGYATNPRYTAILIKLIEDYDLTQYDGELDKRTAKELRRQRKVAKEVAQEEARSGTMPGTSPADPNARPVTLVDNTIDLSKYNFDERLVNNTKAIIYKSNIPFSAIVQKYGLSVDELYAYNDMPPSGRFKDNDMIYLEDKRPESAYYQYETSEGETMRDISQKFAVTLAGLYKRNGLSPGAEPLAGEVIVLRGSREYPLKYKSGGKIGITKITAEAPKPGPSEAKVHKVGTSDTLYSIARQYNIPVDDLKKLNGLKDADIKIGQTIIVSL